MTLRFIIYYYKTKCQSVMSRSRNFSATHNNPQITGQEWIDMISKLETTYAICQLEKGEEGTPHL